MLRSIKELIGKKLSALDGEIGPVKDFYFNDQDWVVRYVVVDTGPWLSGQTVLISPHAFIDFDAEGVSGGLNLTRKQIENSPPLEVHRPVSKQFQEEYYHYYGLSGYWEGDDVWGAQGEPTAQMQTSDAPKPSAHRDVPNPRSPDAHLRSAVAVTDYHIQTATGTSGYVSDFLVDGKSWVISQFVVELWDKEVSVSPKTVERIRYNESKIYMSITQPDILNASDYHRQS